MFKKKVRVSNSKNAELFFEEEADTLQKRLKPILAVIGGFRGSA